MNINFDEKNISTNVVRNNIYTNKNIDIGQAFAIKLPKRVGNPDLPIPYLKADPNLEQYLDEKNIKDVFDIMNRLYLWEDLFGRAIDLYVTFSATRLKFLDSGNEEFDKIIKYWAENVNRDLSIATTGIRSLKKVIVHQYWKLGNVFPYETWENVNIGGKNYKLPTKIMCLNPNKIKIDDTYSDFGEVSYNLEVDVNVLRRDGRTNPQVAPIKRTLKRSTLDKIRTNTYRGNTIELNSKLIYHIKRAISHHQVWGVPYGLNVLGTLRDLHKKREMDGAVIDRIIKRILLFKLGTDEFPADNNRLAAFKNLLDDPEPSFVLVTPHDVDYNDIIPNTEILDYEKKYEPEMTRFMIAMGIPPVLFGLSGSKDVEQEINYFAETAKEAQFEIKDYMINILTKIAQQNNIDITPAVDMERINANKSLHMALMHDVYFTGCLSKRTYLDMIDFDLDTEVKRREDEESQGIDELMTPPEQPFQGNQTEETDNNPQPMKPNEKKQDKKKKNKRQDQ